MAYTAKTWVTGEVITAEALNHLEQGVANEQVGPQGPQGPQGPEGPPGPAGSSVAGVASFNGRTGAVVPGSNDYTADMVGAIPAGTVVKNLPCGAGEAEVTAPTYKGYIG